jgi:hypothetical protein
MMRKLFFVFTLLVVMGVSAACAAAVPPTGDTANQFLSAQQQMPGDISGYLVIQADTIQAAVATAAQAAGIATTQILGAAVVNRLDALVTCYREVGAVDAKIYVSPTEPGAGVAVIINNDRIANNLLQCAAQAAGARSQDAGFQPCVQGGTFQRTEGAVTNTFSFIYAGSTPTLCNAFNAHFVGRGWRGTR